MGNEMQERPLIRLELGMLLLIFRPTTLKPAYEQTIHACVFLVGTFLPLTPSFSQRANRSANELASVSGQPNNQFSSQSCIQTSRKTATSTPTNRTTTYSAKPSVLPRCRQMKPPHTHPVGLSGFQFKNSLSQRPAISSVSHFPTEGTCYVSIYCDVLK